MKKLSYPELYRWLQARASMRRELKYGKFGRPIGSMKPLNTTHVRSRPSRGTSNPNFGIYRTEDPNKLLYAHAEVGRHYADLSPRLRKR